MSRSYKRTPYIGDNSNKWAKRQASKRARKADLDDGGAYKKVFCSWDIKDWGQTYSDRELAVMDDKRIRWALNK